MENGEKIKRSGDMTNEVDKQVLEIQRLQKKLHRASYITSLLGVVFGGIAFFSSVWSIFKEEVFKDFLEFIVNSPAFDYSLNAGLALLGGLLGYYLKSHAEKKEDKE